MKVIMNAMAEQNARAVKYLEVQTLKDSRGKIREINRQINEDLGLAGPLSLSTVSERVHSVRWAVSRESYVASTFISRRDKELLAAVVSQINKCPYCAEAHSATLGSGGEAGLGPAIADGSWKQLSDERTKLLIEWGLSTRKPEAAVIKKPPFSAREAPEIIGTALEFHTLNRLVDIFLEESPLPEIIRNKWIRGIALKMASLTVFREMISKKAVPGSSLKFIEERAVPAKFKWAAPVPAFSKALAAQEVLLDQIETDTVPKASSQVLEECLRHWNGEEMPFGRKWLEAAVSQVPEKEKPVARLILLTAFSSYTVSEKDIMDFREVMPTDRELLEVCYWAAAKTSRRIGSWLVAPFQPALLTESPQGIRSGIQQR